MEEKSQKKKKTSKKNTAIWIILCLILVIGSIILSLFLHDSTRIINQSDDHSGSVSLSCEGKDASYPFFSYDNSKKKELKINVIFLNNKPDTISLIYKLYYNSANDIKASETTNHAEMNKSFASHGLSADAFGANYSELEDAMQMVLYANSKQLDDDSAKFFLMDEEPGQYKIEGLAKMYNKKGLNCVIKK